MIFTESSLAGCYIIELTPFSDDRGWFARTYCKDEFQKIGHTKEWLQMNHSFTAKQGALRGMHFQKPPYSEIKLVRCIAGAVFDVVIDLRKTSPSFMKWFGVELSAKNKKMIYIPEGFAHGFQTLTDNCELIYSHSAMYMQEAEGGLMYNDPALGIEWPLAITDISEKDKKHNLLDKNFNGI